MYWKLNTIHIKNNDIHTINNTQRSSIFMSGTHQDFQTLKPYANGMYMYNINFESYTIYTTLCAFKLKNLVLKTQHNWEQSNYWLIYTYVH